MTKHAYLIMAHSHFEQLSYLVSLLDDSRNDIYIHIDKKSPFSESDRAQIVNTAQFSKVVFTHREKIYWGGVSQMKAEMILFKEAYQENYSFYHLISGLDLPLQSQDYIHRFFSENQDKLFLTMMTLDGDKENIDRYKYYHLFEKLTPRSLSGILGKGLFKVYRKSEVFLQKLLRIDRYKKNDVQAIKYAQWVSLPHYAVELLVAEEDYLSKIFSHSFLCDEVFIAHLLQKHDLLKNLYSTEISYDRKEDFQGNLRYINWWDGNPYTWTDSEQDRLALEEANHQGYIFSRKFDTTTYPKTKAIVEKFVNNQI